MWVVHHKLTLVFRSMTGFERVLLDKMKLMMEGQNRSINRTHRSALVIFARLWIYTPKFSM